MGGVPGESGFFKRGLKGWEAAVGGAEKVG